MEKLDTRSGMKGKAAAVEKPAQIRALASTVRQDIVDTLQALGRASVPELAEHLGRPADSLYYHVRALLKAKLLVQVETRQRGRHVEAVYATPEPDKRLMLSYRPGRPASARALGELVASMLRAAQREFDAAIADPACVVDGPRRELWAGRAKGWLSDAELERCNALLAELAMLLSSPRTPGRDRLFSLQFLLAPAAAVPRAEAGAPQARRPATPARRRSPRTGKTP